MKTVLEDATHAWLVVSGFILGIITAVLGIAAGAKQLHALVTRMNLTIEAAEKATAKAHALSVHVSTQYVPVLTEIRAVHEEVQALRREITGPTGGA